nr:signal peptidase I [Oliverpabstia intestinalis]
MKKRRSSEIPSIEELEAELRRSKSQEGGSHIIIRIISVIVILSAAAILISALVFPVTVIRGSSMAPGMYDGNVIMCLKNGGIERGDIIAFSYANRTLVRRVIACSGDQVEMDETGYVYVNGEKLSEPYVQEHTMGQCDIKFPFQVPQGCMFVMGDNRRVSLDSRSESIGCVTGEQISGKAVFRIWPIKDFGPIEE